MNLINVVWAKSGENGGHSLLAHMLDVAAAAEAILKREPFALVDQLATLFDLPRESALRTIAYFVGLHDYGKAIPGFQAKWPAGKEAGMRAGLTFTPAISLKVNIHSLATTNLLPREAGINRTIARVIGGHHGYVPRISEIKDAKPSFEHEIWEKTRREIFERYRAILGTNDVHLDFAALPSAFPVWLAGLTAISDWIGSNTDFFPYTGRPPIGREYYKNALDRAENALESIDWPKYAALLKDDLSPKELIQRILGKKDVTLRPLQEAAVSLLESAEKPTLLIVEAPMGEGKTEFAFIAHLTLQRKLNHRGFYIALPTQATGNAMYARAVQFLENFNGNATRLDVQLAHAGARVLDPVFQTKDIHGDSDDQKIEASSWFSKSKRALISPYGVGTVDQALLGTLHVKHHFVRLWGLANRVVILDEIHAYDTYTTSLIVELLRWLKDLHCSVILMSATLPRSKRAELIEAWGSHDNDNTSYPRVLMAQGEAVTAKTFEAHKKMDVHIGGLNSSLDSLCDWAREQVEHGGCGALILNTVARTQEAYRKLKEKVPEDTTLVIYHARYPGDQRMEIEKKVLSLFGPRGDRPPRALLIATQVAEQSLDVDFDFMLSDLAPIDLLLQRAGRLHRHNRQRPPKHAVPRFYVCGLTKDRPDLKSTKWGFVYNPYILLRTWKLLQNELMWQLPNDIDRLVQAVYEDFLDDEEFDDELGAHFADVQEQIQRAKNVVLDARSDFDMLYEPPRSNEQGEGGLEVATRLGSESITIVPVWKSEGGWHVLPNEAPFDPQQEISHSVAIRIYQRQLRINRKDVIKLLKETPVPRGFEESPILRGIHPLPLTDGKFQTESATIILDPELGLLYLPSEVK